MAFVFLACMIHVSKVPAKFIGKGLKPIVILLLFTVAMNLFLTRGGAVLFHWGIITITETGLRTSVFMAVRLVLLVAGSSLMTFTTTPNGLTDGLEKLLHPLNRIHVPVHEISMMMSIALRFIPILLTGEEIHVMGSSRTDAGVHACMEMWRSLTLKRGWPQINFSYALNQRLPEDIRIQDSCEVPADFHPRFQKTVKTYEYRILNREFPPPAYRFNSHFTYRKLDVERMRQAAAYLIGEHDFRELLCGGRPGEDDSTNDLCAGCGEAGRPDYPPHYRKMDFSIIWYGSLPVR